MSAAAVSRLPRRQIPAGGQALHLAHGKFFQLRRRLVLRQRQPPEGAGHQPRLHGRRHVLLHLPHKGFQRLLYPSRLTDADQAFLRQIVEGRGRIGIHRRQVPVAARGRHPLPQRGGILLQPLPQSRGALLLRQPFDRRVHSPGSTLRRVRIMERQHLSRRQHRKRLPVLHAALGGHVEVAHAVQLIVEELTAHRPLRPR